MPYLVAIACCLSCNLPLVPSVVVNCPAAIKPLIPSRSSTGGGLVVVIVDDDAISDKCQIGLFKKVGATPW